MSEETDKTETPREFLRQLNFITKNASEAEIVGIKKIAQAHGSYVETRNTSYVTIAANIDGVVHRVTVWGPTSVITAYGTLEEKP